MTAARSYLWCFDCSVLQFGYMSCHKTQIFSCCEIQKSLQVSLPTGCIYNCITLTLHRISCTIFSTKRLCGRLGLVDVIPCQNPIRFAELIGTRPELTGFMKQAPLELAFFNFIEIFYHNNMVKFNHFLEICRKPRPQYLVVRGFSRFWTNLSQVAYLKELLSTAFCYKKYAFRYIWQVYCSSLCRHIRAKSSRITTTFLTCQ